MNIEFENILKVDGDLVEIVRQWRNSEHINKYMITNHYIDKDEHQKWINGLKKDNNAKAWIIKYKNKPIGVVALSNIDYKNRLTEWGFYIAEESDRGKGIGKLALYKLMSYVFDELNFKKMSTKVLDNNEIAMKLYKKFGFEKERELKNKIVRNGKIISVQIMSISQEKWKNINRFLNFK